MLDAQLVHLDDGTWMDIVTWESREAAEQAARKSQKAAAKAADKEHKYLKCPKCKQEIRVPKGAGKIRITCPKCQEKFEKKV